ncbi:MAG: beta-lactamase family protein, partial [Planctomycetales bacterium]
QRELPVPIWGTADAGEKITVSFASQQLKTVADDQGKWMVNLTPLKTSNEEQTLTVSGSNVIRFQGVLVGEVWLCSGQSNMADSFNPQKNRFIEPKYLKSDLSRYRVSTKFGWDRINDRTQRSISRVGFYFGLELYQELKIPVGLILRYNSGTPIQSWIPKDASEVIRKRLGIPADWKDEQENRNPGVQFSDKISPIVPFAFRGVTWYQGERNAKAQTGWEYRDLLPFHIKTWRALWADRAGTKIRDFPFYYVQPPTQEAPTVAEWPWLRDSLRRALAATDHTGMAVFYDHGPSLHPENKQPAGRRLALWALAKDYGREDLVHSGPLLDQVKFADGKTVMRFTHVGGGLRNASGGQDLKFFEVAGKDGKYVAAEARIEGATVVARSKAVSDPAYVRYLFRKPAPDPEVSLVNAEGLPASSFMTDDFKPSRDAQLSPRRKPTTKRPSKKPRENKRKRPPDEQQADKGKRPPESNGLAPEVVDLTAGDVSYALEKKLPDLKKAYVSESPRDLDDGISVGTLGANGVDSKAILAFAEEIAAGKHGEIDSLLLHHRGKLVLESYYRKGRINYPHYQMSITKSYTAMAIGRAIQLGRLTHEDLHRPVVEFLKQLDRDKLAPGADTITLAEAMNMRSGIRLDPAKVQELRRAAGALRGQGQIQAYLQHGSPITEESKTFKYQSSDPSITMQVLEASAAGSARKFIETELLAKMGVTNFAWQDDVSGLPKSAAGSSMRSRDMLTWGMLVAAGGKWNGEQLIPKSFVEQATGRLHVNPQGTSYGYFWWRHDMRVGDRKFDCKSGRGAGGQFILLLPELELIAVITAHNKGMGAVLTTFPKRVLPAFVKQPSQ